MNKERRKALSDIMEQLEELKSSVEEIQEDEDESRENMPENLQGTERYERSEEASENLSGMSPTGCWCGGLWLRENRNPDGSRHLCSPLAPSYPWGRS